MAYKCVECEHVFEEGQQDRWSESRGEFWGVSCSETVSGCPVCHGAYEKAEVCKICGSAHFEEFIHGGVCDDCIDKYRFNPEVLYNIGKNDTDSVEINCFLSTIFTAKEIDEILKREMETIAKYGFVNGNEFIDRDVDWFGEMLDKEVNG